MSGRLLITGFGPFPGVRTNPTAKWAERLARSGCWRRLGIDAEALVLPTEYARAKAHIDALARSKRVPRAVLMLGVAGRRRVVSVEKRARNLCSLRHPDAAGATPASRYLRVGGLAANLAARAPLGALRAGFLRRGVPARLSRDAGAYLCNAGYWWMLETMPSETTVVFVHLPGRVRRGKAISQATLFLALKDAARTLIARSPTRTYPPSGHPCDN